MNQRQRARKHVRRRAHAMAPDEPTNILALSHYSPVKQGHIVPAMYQRNFAVDGTVAVHIDERADCVPMSVLDAGTRSRYYRRTRPDGTEIDDFEATLASAEDATAPVLRDIVAGEPLTSIRKNVLAQFFGIQMVRGPAFFAMRERTVEEFFHELTALGLMPGVLEEAGGDLGAVRQQVVDAYKQPTEKLMDMSRASGRVGALLGHMRWQLLRFDIPILAYSDQPVVLWLMDSLSSEEAPPTPQFGPMDALEVRVPLSPTLALLMTWSDGADSVLPATAQPAYAGEFNALTIAQADRQWMHMLGPEPPVAAGPFEPLSRVFAVGYTAETAKRSQRYARAAKYMHRNRNKSYLNSVEVVTVS